MDGLKFKPYSVLKLSRKYTYELYMTNSYYTEITTIELAYEYQDSCLQWRIYANDVVQEGLL